MYVCMWLCILYTIDLSRHEQICLMGLFREILDDGSPPNSQKFAPSPQPNFYSVPSKSQFPSPQVIYNPIKVSFLAVGTHVPFLF